MEDKYNEIIELDKLNIKGNINTHMSKLMEELGEFASEANKLTGLKRNKNNETHLQIVQNLANEAADTIQNIMCVCGRAGVTYKQLVDALGQSNLNWKQEYLVRKYSDEKQ